MGEGHSRPRLESNLLCTRFDHVSGDWSINPSGPWTDRGPLGQRRAVLSSGALTETPTPSPRGTDPVGGRRQHVF